MISCKRPAQASRRVVLLAHSHQGATQPTARRFSTVYRAEMLKSAAKQYDESQRSSQNTGGSAKQPSRDEAHPSKGLKPGTLSQMNAGRPTFKPPLNQGIKRTANGFVKAFQASFEDEGSSHKITVKTSKGGSAETIVFDENDFDSDVDLDVEPARPAVVYPTLPTITQSSEPPKTKSPGLPTQILYPTLPRQQAVQTSYHDFDMPPPPQSSGPADWSSSPLQHMQPKLAAYAYGNAPVKAATDEETQPKPGPRTIPWKQEEKPVLYQKSSKALLDRTSTTPATKVGVKKASELWSNTASAIKEQQKKHREEARKITVKKNSGTEETILAAKVKKTRVPKIFLSEEQQHILNLVVEERESVFFTGSAGTGKSVLLREIIAALRKKYAKETDRVAVTASTGFAACNIGGVTLHSYSGIGLGKEDVTELVRKVKRNQKARHRWLRTKVLIIDEVSMVDGELFDKLESIARQIRNNGRPFGGIQLIITGDFFQLPPVPEGNRAARFAFDASTWVTTVKHTIALHQVFRQKDPVFAGMLNEMREGRLSESSTAAFKLLDREVTYKDEILATELFPTRAEVERANVYRLGQLEGKVYTFEARDGGSVIDKVARDRLLSSCMAPETIKLKKGSQVMLIKNIDESLVNGSTGRVIAFMDENHFDKYNLDEEMFPQADDGTIASQAVTESREDQARRRLNDNLTTSRLFPLVRFAIPDGTSRDLLCQPETWKVELPSGDVQASRSQVPLILSWALSIHKAQGQTLERVKVNLTRAFEKGQAYVALSRATSMAGLQVIGFHPSKIMAHEKVVKFYANLARVELQNGKSGPTKTEHKSEKYASEYERRFQEDVNNV